jgi:hypothetical protein
MIPGEIGCEDARLMEMELAHDVKMAAFWLSRRVVSYFDISPLSFT